MNTDQRKFLIALVLFVLPSLISLTLQKEIWPFSHYPMFSTIRKTKKFAAVRVFAEINNEQRQLETYNDLFPLGPQCTIKLLLEDKMSNVQSYSPDLNQAANLKNMSDYYRKRAGVLFGTEASAISIYFVSFDYSQDWRHPVERKKLIWNEKFHE